MVAHLNNQLSDLVHQIQKAKKKPNLMKLAVHGMPAGTGKKGGRQPRKRSKVVVEERVERFSATTVPQGQSSPISITIASGTHSSIQQACSSSTLSTSAYSPPGPRCYAHPQPLTSPGSTYYPHHQPQPYQPYTAYSPYPPSYSSLPPFSQPSLYAPSTESPFTLAFIKGNISVCAGCSNSYVMPATPPQDICVKHTEWHSFTVDGTPKTKFAPAYYHVNL